MDLCLRIIGEIPISGYKTSDVTTFYILVQLIVAVRPPQYDWLPDFRSL